MVDVSDTFIILFICAVVDLPRGNIRDNVQISDEALWHTWSPRTIREVFVTR